MEKSTKNPGPVLLDVDGPVVSPADAPAVPDVMVTPETGLQQVARRAARRPSRLWRWFWAFLSGLIGLILSVAAWDFVNSLIARFPVLGWLAVVLIAGIGVVLLVLSLGELAAFARLRRVDRVQGQAVQAIENADIKQARQVGDAIVALYRGRDDTAWGRDRFTERRDEVFDADGLLGLAETEILVPLDKQAEAEIEAAARQVALITAIVPLAMADLIAALSANLRMIRRIAEIYGGRSGGLSSWRLTRTVLTHLVATGAVAVGDDLIGSIAGGGALSKVSRRFGEGVINGALTARVGVAAIEVCRPLPRITTEKPGVTGIVRRALSGVFSG